MTPLAGLALPVVLAAAGPGDSLPPVGIAARDTADAWCASLAAVLEPGAAVTLVFPHRDAAVRSQAARVVRRRPEPCPAAFPQLSLEELPAYDLAGGPGPGATPSVGLVVAAVAP